MFLVYKNLIVNSCFFGGLGVEVSEMLREQWLLGEKINLNIIREKP